MEVTTEQLKWRKIRKNSMRRSFFPIRAKKASPEGQSPLQELEVGRVAGCTF